MLSPSTRLIKPDQGKIRTNLELLQYFEENPLIYTDRIRVGTAQTALVAMNRAKKLIDTVETPFLVVQ